jgi:anti-sigma-K factor RskA
MAAAEPRPVERLSFLMNDNDDIAGLAAEYVLGSLDVAERKEVAAQRKTDPALEQAIKDWEGRLGPLSEQFSGVQPPPRVFQSIAFRLSAQENQPVKLTRASFVHGRTIAAGVCALAACLALAVVWLRDLPGLPTIFTAQLRPSAEGSLIDDGPNIWTPIRFDVAFDLRASTMVVSPVAAGASPTRNYQLWLIPRDHGPPISLGIIPLPGATTSAWQATYPPDDLPNAMLTVSLEPQGGSLIGMPSGPLVFIGKLSQAMP